MSSVSHNLQKWIGKQFFFCLEALVENFNNRGKDVSGPSCLLTNSEYKDILPLDTFIYPEG